LFSQSDAFKFFPNASQIRDERVKKVSDIQVQTTSVTAFRPYARTGYLPES